MRNRMTMAMRAGAVAVAVVAAASAMADDGCAPPYFIGPSSFSLGSDVFDVEVLDTNGDGMLDVLATGVADGGGGQLWCLLGSGDGQLQLHRSSLMGAVAGDFVTTDLDGDGHLDCIVADRGAHELLVALGAGDGSFEVVDRLRVADQPDSVRLADLNGDGRDDLTVLCSGEDVVQVLLADDSGSWLDAVRIYDGRDLVAMAIVETNADGVPDCVVLDAGPNAFQLLNGQGDGTFALVESIPAEPETLAFTMGDLDQDGHADLVSVNDLRDAPMLSRRSGDGRGGFGSPVHQTLASRPRWIELHDVDRDQQQDAVVIGESVALYLGDGAGGQVLGPSVMNERDTSAFTLADLDANGVDDLIMAGEPFGPMLGQTDGDLTVMRRSLDGSFVDYRRIEPLDDVLRSDVQDLNGDGIEDLVIVTWYGYQSYTGSSDVGLEDQGFVPFESLCVRAEFADVNGDGRNDILTSVVFEPFLRCYLSSPDGGFVPAPNIEVEFPMDHVAVGDLNGDRIPDILYRDFFSPDYSVVLGYGFGWFSTPIPLGLIGSDPLDCELIDLDGDGVMEIVVLDRIGSRLLFRKWVDEPIGTIDLFDGASALERMDLNGDGLMDLFVPSILSKESVILLNTGNGIDMEIVELSNQSVPFGGAVGQLDHLGPRDLVVVTRAAYEVWIGSESEAPERVALLPRSGPLHLHPRPSIHLIDQFGDGARSIVEVTLERLVIIEPNCAPSTPCPADLDASGTVDFDDLLIVLGAWGTDGADVTGDGFTDFDDVLAIIAAWGAC